jgi:predicted HicB family RNase H-like nuclease
MPKQIWKPIPEWEEFYEVSNLGNVRSIPRSFTRLKKDGTDSIPIVRDYKKLIPTYSQDKSASVNLNKNGKSFWYSLPYLVLLAFKSNDLPEGKTRFDFIYKDQNKLNCCANNLEWKNKAIQKRLVLGLNANIHNKIHKQARAQKITVSQYITNLFKATEK